MPEPLLSFVSVKWIKPLAQRLRREWARRDAELNALYDAFGDPRPLADCYVEPRLQHHNPADHAEDEANIAYLRAPAFEAINLFLSGSTPLRDGRSQLFLLSDAGMGKTSLLLMLKLGHLLSFWPKRHRCTLLKLGPDTLVQLQQHADKGDTVLLLDALDEDPTAWGQIEARLIQLLQASEHFRRVIISCRTQFFPETGVDSFGRAGRVVIGGYTCPMYFMSLFDDEQVQSYLHKHFPDRVGDRLLFRPNPLRERAAALVEPIGSLRFRPLLLAHIESILDDDPREASALPEGPAERWSAYRLYQALLEQWLLREQLKLQKQMEKPPTHAALLAVCMQVAVHLQAAGERALSKTELELLAARHPALRHLERFDLGGRSLLNRNCAGDYRFSHYSIQEFLVVRALADGALDLRTGLLSLNPAAPDWQTQAVPVLVPEQRLRLTDQMVEFIADTPLVLDEQTVDFSDVREEGRAGLAIRTRLADGTPVPVMQYVPSGTFQMGSPESERGSSDYERPQHRVEIAAGFWLGRYPVTFDEYDPFCAATGRRPPSDRGWGRGSRPVINITWEDAGAYCAWLSEQTGETYRLPTEAEWEYACRAGSRMRYSFGDSDDALTEHAWFDKNAGGRTHPVGEKRRNLWGLHDIHGNVWEWTQDHGRGGYIRAPTDGAWLGGDNGAARVFRGGSWNSDARNCRCAARSGGRPADRGGNLGFRCARVQS